MNLFLTLAKPLGGKGLGRFPGVKPAYRFLCRYLVPDGISTVQYDELDLDIERRAYPEMLLSNGIGYLPLEVRVFKNLIKPGMTVLDLGSSIGYFTLAAARIVGPTGKVYAFEPTPRAFELLKKNIERNRFKNIIPINKAVADYEGTANFYLSRSNPLANSLGKGRTGVEYIGVQVTTLDSFLEEEKVDVIKMNIEGAELLALRGMSKLLERNPSIKIMTEFDPQAMGGLGISPEEYIQTLLRRFDLQIILIKEGRIVPFEGINQAKKSLFSGVTYLVGAPIPHPDR